ncbi:unnamed protein product [Rotaria magnacalcarata]
MTIDSGIIRAHDQLSYGRHIFGYDDGTFREQVTYSVGFDSHPYSVAVGDCNNDNRLDIVVANHGTNSIEILIGKENKPFANVFLKSLGSYRPVWIAAGSWNKDMFLDIAVVSYATSSIVIALGYGNTTFTVLTEYSTGYDSLPQSAVIADLNRDNYFDSIISNSGTSNAAVLLGYGNGSFTYPKLYLTGVDSSPFTVAVGNLNDDNQLDIAVASYGTSNIGTLIGHGDGPFTKIEISSIGYKFRNGTLRSQEIHFIETTSAPAAVLVGEFSSDTRLDVVTINTGINNVTILLGYGDGSFGEHTDFSTGNNSSASCVTVGDFNKDNLLDIAVSNSKTNNAGILVDYGNGNSSKIRTFSTGHYFRLQSIVTCDLNHDNILDIAVANYGTSNIGILLGYGNGTLATQVTFSSETNISYSIAIGDFNSYTLLDVTVDNYGTASVTLLRDYDNGTFVFYTTLSTDMRSSPYSITLGDLNNDHILDVTVASKNRFHVAMLLGLNNETFTDFQTFSTGNNSYPVCLTLNDCNQDSIPDIAVANSESNTIGILMGHGDGTFAAERILINDSILDIAVANHGANSITIHVAQTDRKPSVNHGQFL